PGLRETDVTLLGRTAEFDLGHLFKEPLDDLDAVATLSPLVPGLEELPIIVMIGRILEVAWGAIFHRDLDSALALMSGPNAVIEAKLNLLFDVAGAVVRRDPAGVNVERGLTTVRVSVDHLQLHRVPGWPVRRTDQSTLAIRRNPGETPGSLGESEAEID